MATNEALLLVVTPALSVRAWREVAPRAEIQRADDTPDSGRQHRDRGGGRRAPDVLVPAPDRLNRNRPRKKLEWSQTKRCREAGHVVRERAAFGTPRDVRFEQHRFELGDLRVEPKREQLASTPTVRTGSALFLHTSSGRRSFEIVSNEREGHADRS